MASDGVKKDRDKMYGDSKGSGIRNRWRDTDEAARGRWIGEHDEAI